MVRVQAPHGVGMTGRILPDHWASEVLPDDLFERDFEPPFDIEPLDDNATLDVAEFFYLITGE